MRFVGLATLAAAALVALYLALGGTSYAPAKSADPCASRDWREPDGLQEVGEQIVLSALDGAACELGATREEVVLAFGSRAKLDSFAREHDITTDELEQLFRAGLERAIDDAEEADALNPTVASLIRGVVERAPIEQVVDLLDQLPGL
jgi:hypothetical protein